MTKLSAKLAVGVLVACVVMPVSVSANHECLKYSTRWVGDLEEEVCTKWIDHSMVTSTEYEKPKKKGWIKKLGK